MTSAPMSASIRAQCGPAMVVEKSSTRRPAKAFVAEDLAEEAVAEAQVEAVRCDAVSADNRGGRGSALMVDFPQGRRGRRARHRAAAAFRRQHFLLWGKLAVR
ncbi:hypothetical protein OO17_19355 [Rhodopseudomonas palustris]|uniref:Uncharacterized protein n=1 Tax=Rhodopseudomonas palustris TaxID=1076 RepID=A0A0D7EH35_RHOPL|nr:hypothetical protein OO17_19355 [Rhodopseudomonas palustris]